MAEKTETKEGGYDWGLAIAIAPTFYAVVFSVAALGAGDIHWGFGTLIAVAYIFLAVGFLGLYVEINKLLLPLTPRAKRIANILITVLALVISALSISFLSKHLLALWLFGVTPSSLTPSY